MTIIPNPDEARELRALSAGNPIVDLAETALRGEGATDAQHAADLLPFWRHYGELSDRERAAVIARFVPGTPQQAPAAPVVVQVANALHVLGAVTRTNADALLSLTVVQLTDAERAAVLDAFPAEVFPGAGGHMGTRPAQPGQLCACGRPAVRVDITEHAGDVPTCGQHHGGER